MPQQFDAELLAANDGGCFVAVPQSVVDALGGGGRIPVAATFDGVGYRGSVVSMGDGKVIGVRKATRTAIGKGIGDTVAVTLERDKAPRTVTLAGDVAAAFDAADVFASWNALSYSHQREQAGWIESAKRAETRSRRIAVTIERLHR